MLCPSPPWLALASRPTTLLLVAAADRLLRNRGLNNSGQLGQGEELDRRGDSPETLGANLPAVALGAGDVPVAIDCGSFHTCILLADASVKW